MRCCPKFFIYHGESDPYVPLHYAEHVARQLEVPVRVIRSGGHLNKAAGMTTFPLLLADILSAITSPQYQSLAQ